MIAHGAKEVRMLRKKFRELRLPLKILVLFGIMAVFTGFTFLFGLLVMVLWNWLMPDIFGLARVDFWHAWGLLLLSHILFKSWGGRHWGPRSPRRGGRSVVEPVEGENKPSPEVA